MAFERNGNVRCITDLPKELNNQVEAAMKSEGYNSKSNFIRSAVEEKINRLTNGEENFIKQNENFKKTLDEKNKQIVFLLSILDIVLFSQSKNISKKDLNKFIMEVFEVGNK